MIVFYTFNLGKQTNLSTSPTRALQSYVKEIVEGIPYQIRVKKLSGEELYKIEVEILASQDEVEEIFVITEEEIG